MYESELYERRTGVKLGYLIIHESALPYFQFCGLYTCILVFGQEHIHPPKVGHVVECLSFLHLIVVPMPSRLQYNWLKKS